MFLGFHSRWSEQRVAVLFLLGLACFVLALRLLLLFRLNINWDEFATLAKVYLAVNGELSASIQNFNAVLFSWLPLVGGGEIRQIEVARLAIFILSVFGYAAFYHVIRPIFRPRLSAMAILMLVGFSYAMEHGSSLRHDTVVTPLSMIALWLFFRRLGVVGLLLSACLLALALLLTVKTVLFLSLFLGIAVLGAGSRQSAGPARLVGLAIFSGLFYLLAYSLFRQLFPGAEQLPTESFSAAVERFLPGAVSEFLLPYLVNTMLVDIAVWALAGCAALCAIAFLIGKKSQRRRWSLAVVCLMLPFLSFVLYRNLFPYFYVMLLPNLVMLSTLGLSLLLDQLRARYQNLLQVILSLLLVISSVSTFARHSGNEQSHQSELLALVHQIFPDPAPYIDRCGMVSAFPWSGFFMSTAVLESYHQRGAPRLAEAIATVQPRFVLANHPALLAAFDSELKLAARLQLLPEDAQALRRNYVHHWGELYVAGKELLANSRQVQRFTLQIGGRYTVYTASPVEIDGHPYNQGDVLWLAPGAHDFKGTVPEQPISLKWAMDAELPEHQAAGPLFTGFRR